MADDDLIVRAQLVDELSGGLRGVRRELERTEKSAATLGLTASKKTGVGLDQVATRSRTAQRGLRDLHQSTLTVSRSLGDTFVTGARRGVTALGLLTGAVGGFGLKAAGGIQQSRVAIDTLVGSAEKGERVFQRIQAMNLKSPFELGDLTRAGQDLLNSSLSAEKALTVLQSLGDIAALSADPTNNLLALARVTRQVADSNRLLGQDALQFSQAGVNIYKEIANVTGKSIAEVRKLGEEGKISSDVVLGVLANLNGGLQRFVGGSEKANRTLLGQFSNFKDSLTIRLSNLAGPLVNELTTTMPKIIELVGGAVDEIGPPIFGLVGDLVDGVSQLMPILGGPITALLGGLGQLIQAGAPALGLLQPLSEELATSIEQLVQGLLPVMPDVVDLFVAMVGILPAFVDLLREMIPLVVPIVQLVTGLLKFGPVKNAVAGLLFILLGYRAVSSVVGGMYAFATALGVIGNEAQVAGTKASIAYGKLGALAAIAAGGVGVAHGLGKAVGGKGKAGDDLAFVGSSALLGAGIGSVVPVVGTGLGAAAGAIVGGGIVGLGHIFGDPAVPPATMARHQAAAGGNGLLQITSGMRGFGVRSGASGHLNGSAVDVAGPGMASYVQRVRAGGGWAVQEGSHVHAQWGDPATPGGRTIPGMAVGGGMVIQGPLALFTGPVRSDIDVQHAFERALVKTQRALRERAFDDVRVRR